MAKRDYYDVLGVSKNATDQEIKTAFRKLSRKYHPDMQAGKSDKEKKQAEETFKEIAEAYEILSNKDKRTQYDQFGFDGPNMNSSFNEFDMGDFMSRHGGMFGSMFENFSGMFGEESPFGRSRQSERSKPNFKQPENGKNVQIKIEISFKESVNGCKRSFDISLTKPCPTCNGTGIERGSEPIKCEKCNGSGRLVKVMQNGFMVQQIISDCPHCNGTGYIVKHCQHCHGEKRIPDTKHIEIKIPKGIDNGQRLRIPDKGHCGVNGGSNGNLFIEISITKQNIFKRNGYNVETNIDIDPITAILGGKVKTATPYSIIDIEIKPGTTSGTKIVKHGLGIKSDNITGDLIINLNIAPIENLTDDQHKLLNELKNTITTKNFPASEKYCNDAKKII